MPIQSIIKSIQVIKPPHSVKRIRAQHRKNIYKDKVAFMNFRGFPFGVIIKSPQIAKAEKAIFELLWKKL